MCHENDIGRARFPVHMSCLDRADFLDQIIQTVRHLLGGSGKVMYMSNTRTGINHASQLLLTLPPRTHLARYPTASPDPDRALCVALESASSAALRRRRSPIPPTAPSSKPSKHRAWSRSRRKVSQRSSEPASEGSRIHARGTRDRSICRLRRALCRCSGLGSFRGRSARDL